LRIPHDEVHKRSSWYAKVVFSDDRRARYRKALQALSAYDEEEEAALQTAGCILKHTDESVTSTYFASPHALDQAWNELKASLSSFFEIRLLGYERANSLVYMIGHSIFSLVYVAALVASPLVALGVLGLPFFAIWVLFFSGWPLYDAGWFSAGLATLWAVGVGFMVVLFYLSRVVHGLEGLIYSHFRWGRGSEETCHCPACRQRLREKQGLAQT